MIGPEPEAETFLVHHSLSLTHIHRVLNMLTPPSLLHAFSDPCRDTGVMCEWQWRGWEVNSSSSSSVLYLFDEIISSQTETETEEENTHRYTQSTGQLRFEPFLSVLFILKYTDCLMWWSCSMNSSRNEFGKVLRLMLVRVNYRSAEENPIDCRYECNICNAYMHIWCICQ